MKTEYLKKDYYFANEFLNGDGEAVNKFIYGGLSTDVFPELLPKLLFDGEHIISMSSKQYDIDEQDSKCIRITTAVTKIVRCENCIKQSMCKYRGELGSDGFCSKGEMAGG